MTDADFDNDPTPPAPAPAPLRVGLPLEPGGGWIAMGEAESDEERTVTVVFQRAPEDEIETGEFLLRPLAPTFDRD